MPKTFKVYLYIIHQLFIECMLCTGIELGISIFSAQLIRRQNCCFHGVYIITGNLTSKYSVMVPCDKLLYHHHMETIPNHFGFSELTEITHWPLNYITYFYLFTYRFFYYVLISFSLLDCRWFEGRKYFVYHWIYRMASSPQCFI